MQPSGEQPDERLATYTRVLDALDDAVIATDECYRVTVWNPAAERIYGWTAAEALGRDLREIARSNRGASIVESSPDHVGVGVLLVEDHVAVREAIAVAFEREQGFEVVGQAASLAEARPLLADLDIDVAVIDLELADGYGAGLIKELRERNPQAQALVLSASLDRSQLAHAIESGAAGALTKTAHLEEVVEAVRQLHGGAALLPLAEIVELLRFAGREREREHTDRAAISRLTPRELEVLQALADGFDSQAIAERLHITVRTERNHVASILAKLGVHSQLQALVFALRYELVEIRPPGSTSP